MSEQPYRLATGGRVDRTRPVSFTFDGRQYTGFQGDTLASALIANGIHMVARSFKYHRPRGIVGAGSEDPAGLVGIVGPDGREDPNTRVTEQEIYPGLEAVSQNRWPSLKHDVGIVNDWFAGFIPAGFYYKTFIGPPFSWMRFEPIIRAAAGLGVAPKEPDPDRYESINRHCDVLVVGAGPAGLMAALSAARSGARVILAEETAEPGGRLLSESEGRLAVAGTPAADWVAGALAELGEMDNVKILTRACVTGYYADNFLTVWEKVQDHLPADRQLVDLPRQRLWRVRAKQVVLATGAVERSLMFHQNDRPGIMLAGAARTFLNRYGVLAGRDTAVFANNDSAWRLAFDLADAGGRVPVLADIRTEVDGSLMAAAAKRGLNVRLGASVLETRGRRRINSLRLGSVDGDGRDGSWIDCDLLAVSGGWSPNVALFSQSRGKLKYDDDLAAFRPGISWQKERSAGAANGETDLATCFAEGARAGAEAATSAGFAAEPAETPKVSDGLPAASPKVAARWILPSSKSEARTRAFVDLQDDVTVKDLKLAVREGYRSVEHAKRYTTTGMGTDQGKIANINAFGILSGALGVDVPQVGTTTFRQPYKPVTFGALAGQHVGQHFHPRRTTAMHSWHEEHGAIFETVGDWYRPWVYPKSGETPHEALMREAEAARTSAGVLDASTLGKIDIRGKDARTFLNRVYTNGWTKLAPGRCRYGLMLGEDGMVMDDGVTACIADDHFHMTTTTGGAARVLGWLEDYLQTEWPDLEVYLTSTTEQWAVASICGPNAPAIVDALVDDVDVNPQDFPFMHWKPGHMDGVPVRVFHISFTGEVSYEINIPATYGRWMWDKIIAAGAEHGLTPYGTEAMHLLRAEKGFVIVGQDTDGTITPGDLRMDWIVAKKKGDFIGRRSLSRSDTARDDRGQFVGLLTEDPNHVIMEGSQVIGTADEGTPPVPMLGHVTSSYFSPNLGRSIALGIVKRGGARMGETVYISRKGARPLPATIAEVDFLANTKGEADA